MKRLRIEHITSFEYGEHVSASYNEARMLPASSESQFVLSSSLDIEPQPSVNRYLDYFGTQVVSFDVLSGHTELSVTARSLIEVQPRPLAQIGLGWEDLAAEARRAVGTIEMLTQTPQTRPHPEVVELARAVASEHDSPAAAAPGIASAIAAAVEYTQGTTGVHSVAAEAWAARTGVCQDIAHITLGALREVGIPARYVSGYLHPKPDAAVGEPVTGESHAWVEWFTGDWQGFDPTNDTEIGEHHVRVGHGRDYSDVPPLRGVYAGPPKSRMQVSITVTREA